MTALVIAMFVLAFLAYKAAQLAVLVTIVSLAVCVALATSVALGTGTVLAFGFSRAAR